MAARDAYETVPYDDRPVAETHPDRLFAAARGAGLAAIAPEAAHVLELGCAHAVNLMPIAAALPGARVVGIDRSARQIALAQKRTREAGLTNLELRCADVMDLELGEQRFDYVIAHGLISWVPDSVRDRVLQLAHDALSPNGVVYLSFNTMPAWGVRGAVRRALLEIVGDATEERVQIERARAGLAWLAELRPFAGTAEDAVLHEELAGLRERPDMYLLHEYLVPSSRAYWVRELIELATAAGLRWIAELSPTGLDDDAQQQTTAQLRSHVRDPIAVEQLLDVVVNRQLRASLFCRTDATIADAPLPALPRALPIPAAIPERPRVHAVTRLEARQLGFVTTMHHELAPIDPFHAAVIDKLDGTRTHADIVEALRADLRAGRLSASRDVDEALPSLLAGALARLHAAAVLIE